jgi:ELWxxDGT repeat protein
MDRHRLKKLRAWGRRAQRDREITSSSYLAARLDIEPLEERRMFAPVPYLLEDINWGTEGSYPNNFVIVDGLGYFEARGQIWRTDGTPQGTERVGNFDGVGRLAVWQDTLWFTNLENGLELWQSDGSVEGTVRMVSMPFARPGSGELVGTTRGMFFSAQQQDQGDELWTSDGTVEGTRLVKDIWPGKNSSSPRKFVEIGDWVYFSANDGVNGSELWRTDGTAEQTTMLRDHTPGKYHPAPSKPVALNGAAYFTANNRLWKSDGTTAGTVELLRSSANETNVIALNGQLLFSGLDPVTNDVGLWATDGNFNYLINDPNPSGSTTLSTFVVMDGVLYFTANWGELWRSDGTSKGTYSLGRIDGAGGDLPTITGLLSGNDGQLLLTASDLSAGDELWRWDSAGPKLVKDIWPGSEDSEVKALGSYNGLFVFGAADGILGEELWVSDGTQSGTLMLKDIETQATDWDSYPQLFTEVAGVTYFVASTATLGNELWRTDGTESGTMLVKDVSPGPNDTRFRSLHNVNGELWFLRVIYDTEDGREGESELWVSDGSEAGTRLIAKLPYFDGGDEFGETLAIGDTLFFNFDHYDDEDHEFTGKELWSSDGTHEGTKLLKIIPGRDLDSDPGNFIELNGMLYFTANDGSSIDLWQSDGTETGTVVVKSLEAGFGKSRAYYMTRAGGRLFFGLNENNERRSVWTSDGTAQGTQPLYSLDYADEIFNEQGFIPLGDHVVFPAKNQQGDYSIMVSDGTVAGTLSLRDSGTQLTEVNGKVFFGDTSIDNEAEIWETDGTIAGTRLAIGGMATRDFSPPHTIANLNGTLLFESVGEVKWVSDGTSEGTQPIDVYGWNYFNAGDLTYFLKETELGIEPWVLRNATALVDLNGPGAGKSFATSWAGVPVPIADPSATILSSQESLTELRLRLARATPGLLLFSDTSGTEIVATFDGEVLRLSGEDSRDNYEHVLKSVRFHASGEAARLASVDLEVQAFTAEGFAVVPVRTTIEFSPAVVGRRLFYNNSSFDGEDAGANTSDDGSIATDKAAYLPGSGLTTTASVSSYSRGINGVMIDIAGLEGPLTADDFTFRMGTTNSPESWTPAPAPLEVVVRSGAGAGGSDRVTIIWADGAIKNTWLQVVVQGNDAAGGFNTNTGLAASDVFFFGNRVGDSFVGAAPAATVTSSQDELGARFNPGINQPVTSIYDFNRDGVVNAADQLIARNNAGLLLMIDVDAVVDEELAEALVAESLATEPVVLAVASAPTSRRAALAFALATESLDDDPADELIAGWRRARR